MSNAPQKILIVDDDLVLLGILEETLRTRYTVDSASSAAEALEKIAGQGPYAVVVSDRSMPKMNGVELLEQVKSLSPETVRLMLTGDKEQQAAVEAINRGEVFYFLTKPCPPDQLLEAVEAGLNRHRLERTRRELSGPGGTPGAALLVEVLGAVAPAALSRGEKLRESMRVLVAHLKIEPSEPLLLATLLSQLGCAMVPPGVYRRFCFGAELWPQEVAILRQVPQFGHDLLVDLPSYGEIAKIILYQQKNFDGSGLPAVPVKGEEIPLGSRLLKILLERFELETHGLGGAQLRVAMGERAFAYDPRLLEISFTALPEFLVNPLSKDNPVLYRRVTALLPGQILVSDVRLRSGACVLEAGSRLTAAVIRHLGHLASLNSIEEPLLVQDHA